MEFHPIHSTIDSAKKIVPFLMKEFNPNSVLDLGCNMGCWLAEFEKAGIVDILGIDGDNMIPGLMIGREKFLAFDLTSELRLNRMYDMVLCLEVAEHIAENQSDRLIYNLCRHGNLVVFSSAQPNQGGYNHVNEKSIEYWIRKFSFLGYKANEEFRERIPKDVDWWYRNNIVIYAKFEEGNENI